MAAGESMRDHVKNPERGRLLLVDDENEVLHALRRQLRRKYNIYLADSAQEGRRILAETPIHVVVSDQRMPQITGVEFFKTIKNDYPDVVRLILTGYADIHAVIAAINEGDVFRYITKPWEPMELATILDEAFMRYRLIQENRRLIEVLREANQRLEKLLAQRDKELQKAYHEIDRLNSIKDRM